MPGTCWRNFSANVSVFLRHFHFQTSGNCKHQTYLSFFKHLTLYFQTSDIFKHLTLSFSNLIYLKTSDISIFKHNIFSNNWHFIFKPQIFSNIWHFHFQNSDIFKHLTFIFSNLRYFETSDTSIFKPLIFSDIWHFHLNPRSSNFFVVSLAVQSGEGRFCWQLKPC